MRGLKGISVLLFILSFLFSAETFGQEKKERKLTDSGKKRMFEFLRNHSPRARDFHAFGHSLFFDLNLSPIQTYAPDTANVYDTTAKYSRIAEYSIYHFSYFFRLNVIQPDDDHAWTITLNPGIGFGMSQSKRVKGFGAATGGFYLGYEWGNGATYRTQEEKGGFFRVGAEYTNTPLLISKSDRDDNDIRSWVSPVVSFGFRKESKKENLIESNFKIGLGLDKVKEHDSAVNPYSFARPFSFRFSFVVYLDH